MPTTLPCGPTRSSATWTQPPGAQPRIDHAHAAAQQLQLVVELHQLEGGARAVAQALRLGDIGVVELAFEPAGRGRGSAGSRSSRARPGRGCRGRSAPALLCGARLLRCLHVTRIVSGGWYQAGSDCASASRSNRMPSRTPRSPTRSLPTGQVSQIASRMAQPASTRSARSRPMQG